MQLALVGRDGCGDCLHGVKKAGGMKQRLRIYWSVGKVLLAAMAAFAVVGLTGVGSAVATVGPSPSPIEASHDDLKSVDDLLKDMRKQWRLLDRACHPDAVFALTYYVTTAAVDTHIEESYFDDNPFLAAWDLAFADLYMDAMVNRSAGSQASGPWQEAFDWSDTGMSTVNEDLLLGMNAHINYDLAIVTYQMGLVADGRRDDYDRINDVLAYVMREVATELGAHYDPSLSPGATSDLTDPAVLQLFIEWRNNAWNNAAALTAAPDDVSRELVRAQIEAEAVAIAQGLQIPKSDTTQGRVAYCEGSA